MESKAKAPPLRMIRRRRVPRREFLGRLGILAHGKYHVSRALQIGEGGMMLTSQDPLQEGQMVVVSFKLPGAPPEAVRAVVRYVMPSLMGLETRYGVEFIGLDFKIKREIRNYVATSTALAAEVQ